MTDSPLDLRRPDPPTGPDDLRSDTDHGFDEDDDFDDDYDRSSAWSDWMDPTDADPDEPKAPPGFRQVGRNYAPARPDQGGAGRVIATLGAVFAVVIIVVLVVLESLPDTDDQSNTAPNTPLPAPLTGMVHAVPTTTTAPHAIADCPHKRSTALSSGADPGDTTSAVSVIFAFQYAYYVQRSATKAREYVTADANVPPAQHIQDGIDSVPVGTRYCATVVPTAPGRWQVQIREQWPNKTPELLAALIITTATEPDGTATITAINAAP
ncbi:MULTISPECIES: hypothetical protein [Nocardia]|uniref:hypothetical protein n=1 Tax=Nocardia TaxID=1817 RepID=UPI002657DC55|nr:hypothetical protein [Nocardia sp. PE-7]WKG08861.1 hypothetical protein QX204_28090 [Nocardia sp. PE-7]